MKCIKCDHNLVMGVCDVDTCKCICTEIDDRDERFK